MNTTSTENIRDIFVYLFAVSTTILESSIEHFIECIVHQNHFGIDYVWDLHPHIQHTATVIVRFLLYICVVFVFSSRTSLSVLERTIAGHSLHLIRTANQANPYQKQTSKWKEVETKIWRKNKNKIISAPDQTYHKHKFILKINAQIRRSNQLIQYIWSQWPSHRPHHITS